jgi:hypothetical protein
VQEKCVFFKWNEVIRCCDIRSVRITTEVHYGTKRFITMMKTCFILRFYVTYLPSSDFAPELWSNFRFTCVTSDGASCPRRAESSDLAPLVAISLL